MSSYQILSKLIEQYCKKSDEKNDLIVVFKVDDEEKFLVPDFEQGIIKKEEMKPETLDVEFITSSTTLQSIYKGKMTAFTAAGKALSTDDAPLDWKLRSNVTKERLQQLYYFLMHFFNQYQPEKILLGEKHSRVVHGAHAIPLYYNPGFRSGWYLIKKGQKMNEPGDTNPFPQAVVILQGRGSAKIGDDTITVNHNESYYIPPNSDHVFWTEEDEPLILLWLAWGEGA